MPTNDVNTEGPDKHTLEGAQQGHYTDAGEGIGDVQGYQEDNSYQCENLWAPFTSRQGFKFGSRLMESKVSKSRINDYFTNRLGDLASVGYSSCSSWSISYGA